MADNIQTKSEAALVKKVGDIANVLAAAGVGLVLEVLFQKDISGGILWS